MSGKKVQAPCGHPGEIVIGAYARCLQGCSKDPYVQAKPASTARRGEPGHVDFCACKPCTIRRRARTVEFRTKDGQTVAVPWDGVSAQVHFLAPETGTLRHWKILDEEGDVLVDGMCDVYCAKGDPMRLDITMIMPTALTVTNLGAAKRFRQAAKRMNFGWPGRYR